MNDKIRPSHLERTAYVYVRQSTLHQVRNHLESRRRQYDLQNRAKELGFRQVEVIDEDLGVSGTGAKERPGFGRLLAAVCNSQAGAVLALEASRLARNNRDWHHLIDLCVLTDTLVIDADGIYDPRMLNDRLLLGLKGTMSEFELGLLRQRAQEAFRQKVARGEVLFEVPVGYVRTETNGVEMAADRQVQEAIRGIFDGFHRLGSVRQVLLWYRQEKVPVCTCQRQASGERQVVWKPPVYNRLLAVLTNPIYAGAFAYGRKRTLSRMVDGRARKTAGHHVPMQEWSVLIRDHHPGYISWEQFMQNQKQLAENTTRYHGSTGGAAKGGSALLAGLLRCARCGRKLHVCYGGSGRPVARYQCRGGNINHGLPMCLSFGGWRVEQAVTSVVLEALQPLGVEAAMKAWDESRQEQDVKTKTLTLALEKARYEADRLRRQFDAVDSANRLVAAELEGRWNAALAEVEQAQKKVEASRSVQQPLGEVERERLLRLGSDLRETWHHPAASVTLKKRILRTVIKEIVVDVDDPKKEITFRIHWVGGVHSPLRIRKNHNGGHRHTSSGDVVDLVRELVQVCTDKTIAAILNRLGHKTGTGNTWTETRVATLRRDRGIPGHQKIGDDAWLTLADAAKELEVSAGVIRRLLERKVLPAKQVVQHAPWIIRRENLRLPQVQSYIDAVHTGKHGPRLDSNQSTFHL
jgi:DNA invertase Pin-like site-specific DNA recombinase